MPETQIALPKKELVMSNADYHKRPEMSNSKLGLFARDENALEWAENCPVDEAKLKTFDFGDAMHAICLEPDRLVTEFVAAPKFDGRTNIGKAEKKEFYAAHFDKKILTADEYKQLKLMYESVMAHPEARRLIEAPGICESSYFWKDIDTGVECRCRPDKLIKELPHPIDIKTTPLLSKFKFSVEDFRYYVQDPFYCDGLTANDIEAKGMRFLVIQKTIELGRYPVMIVNLPDEVFCYGRDEYKRNLEHYAEYLEFGEGGAVRELEMHGGFMARIENDLVESIT